ncbi:MAG TPA: Gfo/Idh/MocA family oxidoreductase [Chryseosolibacter sp.]|nr:Gfo/Idh/MocA family oxidoreductase [Chryseosolibacter sp.]
MEKIRWGILGCGKIANKFASDLKLVENAVLTGIASRDAIKGPAFQRDHQVPKLYGTYEALASSPEIDVIYVATPHGFHFVNTMLCLEHGKAVLCEKAFGLNTLQVREMVRMAKARNVFLMEAFWTKFLPQFDRVVGLIKSGEIGEIRLIQADFGFSAPEPLAQRLFDPELGGGSLLDIGIYPVFLAQTLLGKPVEIQAMMSAYPTGVDEQCAVTMKFANGALAVLSSTFAADTPVEAMIAGTRGRIHMRNRFHNSIGTIEIARGKDKPEPVEVFRENGYGYQFEARHVGDCLRKGLIESPVMSHNDSITLMETLDEIRRRCGIRYDPYDQLM